MKIYYKRRARVNFSDTIFLDVCKNNAEWEKSTDAVIESCSENRRFLRF